MQQKILLFGQLAELAGSDNILLDDIADTDALVQLVNRLYPAMASIQYIVAVNREMVTAKTPISGLSDIALLPPFSGG